MKMRDLRQLDEVGRKTKATELEHQLRELQAKIRSGREKNHAQLGRLKRDLARVKTLINESKV